MAKTTTVILGAGFGGISTANVLRSKLHSEHRIVLVDRAKRFVVGAGQTWVMLGQKAPEEISLPLDGLARRGIEVVTSEVTAIDPVTRTVTLEGRKLQADHLVLALGAHLNLDAVPGLAAAAHSFYTLDGALELQRALSTFKGGNLVVSIPRTPFKCPPAPYEGALLLADHFAKLKRRKDVALSVYTVEGAPMTTAGPEMGQFVRGLLAEAGIALHTQQKLVRVNPEARTLSFEGGAAVPFDLLVAVPPHEAPKVVREAGLVGESGWIPVDPKTLATKHERVYAIGDVAGVPLPGRFKPDAALALPKAGVFAERQGELVAAQIAAAVLGKKESAGFDGTGFCYIEVGDGKAVRGEGDFFAMPNPKMTPRGQPDAAQLDDKRTWVRRFLDSNLATAR